ncbi:MAG: hypothetical protein ACRDQW_01115 [Haloechinothrix sp.]
MTCASAMLLVSMLALLALMIVARTKASRKDIAELRHEIDNVRPLAPPDDISGGYHDPETHDRPRITVAELLAREQRHRGEHEQTQPLRPITPRPRPRHVERAAPTGWQ